jgi:hypothetical protein
MDSDVVRTASDVLQRLCFDVFLLFARNLGIRPALASSVWVVAGASLALRRRCGVCFLLFSGCVLCIQVAERSVRGCSGILR